MFTEFSNRNTFKHIQLYLSCGCHQVAKLKHFSQRIAMTHHRFYVGLGWDDWDRAPGLESGEAWGLRGNMWAREGSVNPLHKIGLPIHSVTIIIIIAIIFFWSMLLFPF